LGNILTAILGKCDTKPAPDNAWQVNNGQVTVALESISALGQNGGAIYLDGKGLSSPVLVVRGQGGVLRAFQNKCTHSGRKIDPVKGDSALRCCSVNHSTFDYNGKKLTGPATHDIARFFATQNGKTLIVDIK